MDIVIFIVFAIVFFAVGIYFVVSPILWAIWYARRTYRRQRQFSLKEFFFVFTVAALIFGAFVVAMGS
jgi:uncharacterized membrane protein